MCNEYIMSADVSDEIQTCDDPLILSYFNYQILTSLQLAALDTLNRAVSLGSMGSVELINYQFLEEGSQTHQFLEKKEQK